MLCFISFTFLFYCFIAFPFIYIEYYAFLQCRILKGMSAVREKEAREL